MYVVLSYCMSEKTSALIILAACFVFGFVCGGSLGFGIFSFLT